MFKFSRVVERNTQKIHARQKLVHCTNNNKKQNKTVSLTGSEPAKNIPSTSSEPEAEVSEDG